MGDAPQIGWLPVAVIDLNGTCTQLYFGGLSIKGLGINPLQLTLLITTLSFLLFLVIRIPCSISRISKRPNSISKTYYAITWVRYSEDFRVPLLFSFANLPLFSQGTTILCCLRILLTWFVWKEKSTGSEAFWVATSTLFWGIEVSIFVFLFSSHISNVTQLIKRAAIVTIANMVVFATIQVRLPRPLVDLLFPPKLVSDPPPLDVPFE